MSREALGHAWPDIAGRLTDDGHVLPVRVYFEDTDFSGTVYHASYLRFMERGRSDYLRSLGVGHSALAAGAEGEPLSFTVRRMMIDFIGPARIDDLVEIETRPLAVEGARMILSQRIVTRGETLVSAEVTVAVVNGEGRARRIPKSVRSLIAARLGLS
jgi:acyl-CoA thioester hydrolase